MQAESEVLILGSDDPLLLQSNVSIQEVHVSQISGGNTILCPDGMVRTVGGKDIRTSSFMGVFIFGDNYNSGRKPVLKVVITRITRGKTK